MSSRARGIALTSMSVVIAVAFLLGCGGGSKKTGSAGTQSKVVTSGHGSGVAAGDSPSTGGFMDRAERICRETNARLARTTPKGKSPGQVAVAVVENETIERKANGKLAQLTPPPAQAQAWRQMLAYRRQLANQLGALAAAARRNATASLKPLSASKKKLHGELRRLASKAGFKDCAKVGSN